MKKQVIIDKGNGLQQRLSYDEGTNKIIPETTFGPRQTDNVLPVVGKKFIDETDLSVAYGEDCLFCKGKKNTSGIPFATQCAILSGLEVSYSTCAGLLYQSTLYNIKYKGVPHIGLSFFYEFYDNQGKVFKYFVTDSNYSFYLHQNSTNRVDIRLLDFRNKQKQGECILSILAKGAITLNPYKDIVKMKVIYDPITNNIKYVNSNKNYNLNYIDIAVKDSGYNILTRRLISGKIYGISGRFTTDPFYWASNSLENLVFSHGGSDQIAILGYENTIAGIDTNLFSITRGTLPKGTEDDDHNGGG